jgi:hypothetical protein
VTPTAGAASTAVVQMPHVRQNSDPRRTDYAQQPGDTYPLRRSTRAYMRLEPGTYALALTDFINMSALTTNETYINPGGRQGPVNEANVAAVVIDPVE